MNIRQLILLSDNVSWVELVDACATFCEQFFHLHPLECVNNHHSHGNCAWKLNPVYSLSMALDKRGVRVLITLAAKRYGETFWNVC
jgi:hypothetical protein